MDIFDRICGPSKIASNLKVLVLITLFLPSPLTAADGVDDDVEINAQFWLKRSVMQSGPFVEEVGGIIITDGDYQQVAEFIRHNGSTERSEVVFYKQLNIESSISLLNVEKAIADKQLQTVSDSTLFQYGLFLGYQLRQIGVDGCLVQNSTFLSKARHDIFFSGLEQSGLSVLHEEQEAAVRANEQIQEVSLRPRKQFEAFTSSKDVHAFNLDDTGDWIEDWLNHDILIIEESQLESLKYFRRQVNSNKWYRKIARQKENKRISWLSKYEHTTRSVAKPIWDQLRREISRESHVILNQPGALPFPSLEDRFVLLGKEVETLAASMQRYAALTYFTWEQFDNAPEEVLTELLGAGQLIIDYRRLTDIETIQRMIGPSVKMTIIVEDTNALENLLPMGTVVYRSANEPEEQDLAGQMFFGGVSGSGHIPFSISGYLQEGAALRFEGGVRLAYDSPERRGLDARVLQKIDSIVSVSIQEGAFPGCQIAIVKDNALVYDRSFGYFTYDSIYQVEPTHLYDIASVTKVAATLQAVMFLQEQGLISLDEKLSTYLPELSETNKANITIRNILIHEAGLKPWLPFYQLTLEKDLLSPYVYQSEVDSAENRKTFGLYYPTPRQKEVVWQEIIDSELRSLKSGDSTYDYRYSDLGFMFLQMLVENVSGQPLDEFLDQHLYQPLGLHQTLFNPLTKFQKEVIAPTEYDYYFRNAQVWGTVHDQNAQVLGGVAGHAGLFSNAHELSKLMLMNLKGGTYGGYKFLHSPTMQHFTKQQKTGNRRGLGWDKPDTSTPNTSTYASDLTYGHTGFTGTAIWVDPKYDLIYVFLSNRVYPSAENKKLMENNIRSKIQDVIYQAMTSDF